MHRFLPPASHFPSHATRATAIGLWLFVCPGLSAQLSTYEFTPSSGSFVAISGGTALTSIQADDVHSTALDLGFTFFYGGSNVTQVKVNSNGWLDLNVADNDPGNANQMRKNSMASPNSRALHSIMPLWDDLNGIGGTATYKTSGSAPDRVFTMEWLNWIWGASASGAVISFQCKLHETTNIIEFIYQQGIAEVYHGSASIGLTGTVAGSFVSLSDTGTNPTASTSIATNNLNSRPATGQIYRFTPCVAPVITSVISNSPACSSAALTLGVTVTGTSPNYLWSGTGNYAPDDTSSSVSISGAITGSYTVTVSNGCGSTSATVPVTVDNAISWYADPDGDGFGSGTGILACAAPNTGDVANNTDQCPTDPTKQAPGQCGCGVSDVDTDGDGTADCNDACPNDASKTAPGICGCGVADTDTDGDGVADCNDSCPNLAGQIGDACDDGNANTINDVINGACACAGAPVADLAQLELRTDNDGAATSWEIVPLAGGAPVCSGGNYANNSTLMVGCSLPDGCYRLRMFDANMDGMCCMNGLGGYVLRTADGQRIIDAAGAGIFGNTAEVALGFCVPIGGDKLTPSRCDREDYLPNDFIQATPNPAVQAQFNVGIQSDDGYQFWFFNPNGGYSRRVLMTHAMNNYLFPTGPDRCSYLRLDALSSSPIPHNVLMNVRVRSMVNGVYSEFGSACRLRIDLTNQCPTTQLLNDPSSSHHSCGLVNVQLNGSRTLYATPVSAATNYQFEFSMPGYLRTITSAGSSLVLTPWYTMPLQYNSTYDVRVRVSFDNGANYCPFSSVCTISTAPTPPGNLSAAEAGDEAMRLLAWPDPNEGGVLTLKLIGFGEDAEQELSINVVDLFGKQVYTERMVVEGDVLNTTLDMAGYAAGVYLVKVSTADRSWTERVIVQ